MDGNGTGDKDDASGGEATIKPRVELARGAVMHLCGGARGGECQQNRADDHHAFHEGAKPGDLSLQLGTPLPTR